MTDLERIISRRSHVRDGPKRIIVTLYPEGVIGFRREHERKEFCLDIATCYVMAVKHSLKKGSE